MKKLLGNAVKKTTGAAKLVADAAKKGRLKDPSGASSIVGKENDVEKIGRLATEIKSCGDIESGLLGGTYPAIRDGKALVLKRIQAHKSGPLDFENIKFAQELSSPHLGPIWCMRFSQCGQLLATAGQDKELRVWVLKSSYNYFKVNIFWYWLSLVVPRDLKFDLLQEYLKLEYNSLQSSLLLFFVRI